MIKQESDKAQTYQSLACFKEIIFLFLVIKLKRSISSAHANPLLYGNIAMQYRFITQRVDSPKKWYFILTETINLLYLILLFSIDEVKYHFISFFLSE